MGKVLDFFNNAKRNLVNFLIKNKVFISAVVKYVSIAYETFGGEDAYMKRIMQMYDSNGNFVNSRGVAGMLVNGVPQSQRHQIINVSESARDDMYKESLRHFKLENVGLWLN